MNSEQLMQIIRQSYRMDESTCLEPLLSVATFSEPSLVQIKNNARTLITAVRESRLKKSGLDAFLFEYDLSSDEGIALMCLAESLLRTPDPKTRDKLIKDKIVEKDWEKHLGKSHSWFVNAGTLGLMLTGKILKPEDVNASKLSSVFKNLLNRMGEPVIRQAITRGMKILGKQFVMGKTITEALSRAKVKEKQGYRYSYDMLGEAAKTREDANIYFNAYFDAITKIGESAKGLGPIQGPGVSVKLSALHPRYEWANRQRMQAELLPQLKKLMLHAKEYNIGFTIDAEEADRLELSLLLIETMMLDPDLGDWQGFGIALQSYQKRAFYVLDWLEDLVARAKRPLMLRLVKGAYWDSEIKWSQEKGYVSYPVFTRKASTDVSFLACAKKILQSKAFFPQFATHNAYTLASLLEMKQQQKNDLPFEFQCLHGMGDSLYDNIVGENKLNIPCRIYAPVGSHEQLLAYLVRRLLENGANTSFVNRIIDEKTSVEELIVDPVAKIRSLKEKPHPKIPLPTHLYPDRPNSPGLDLSNAYEYVPVLSQIESFFPHLFDEAIHNTSSEELNSKINVASAHSDHWDNMGFAKRAEYLGNMARLLEQNRSQLMALLIREGGKTVPDALSEVREAIDFCWYYANRISIDFGPKVLNGPTGEYNQISLHGRGVFACISPWNFPLAIFLGQVVGALAAGNTVIAKPASQTTRIAKFAVDLLYQAGFPKDVVHLVLGSGKTIGNQLLEHLNIAGVMFTGSTETARSINLTLAKRSGPIIPFIAETGGQNVMIVDSSALPEQVVTDVLMSAFNSAGQRCSACRVLFLQEEISDRIISMLKGAMQELKIGDPFDLATDVGPLIDKNAYDGLMQHVYNIEKEAQLIYQVELSQLPNLPRGHFFAPRAFEIENLAQLKQEVFGPILHIIRYKANELDRVLTSIRQTGYGLTLGIHSRITEVVEKIYNNSHIGNIYVNRNMIGAVVGVQPFGGEGLSGTGPKAGGPHILPRLATERTLSNNIAAAGGNITLMSLTEEE